MADATLKDKRPSDSQVAETKEASPLREAFRSGSVSAALFIDGNVSLRRSYRTATGEWKSTHTLRSGDVPHAIEALQKCLELLQAENAQSK
jgi:hypothetical protein